MTCFTTRIQKVLVGAMLAGGLLFQVAPMGGCDQTALTAFQKGFEYGYNHPEVLDQILGTTESTAASEGTGFCLD